MIIKYLDKLLCELNKDKDPPYTTITIEGMVFCACGNQYPSKYKSCSNCESLVESYAEEKEKNVKIERIDNLETQLKTMQDEITQVKDNFKEYLKGMSEILKPSNNPAGLWK